METQRKENDALIEWIKKRAQIPYKTIHGKRTDVRIFKNPGYGVSNWAFEVVARGTGRTHEQYIPVDRMADAQRTLTKARVFMFFRGRFWWLIGLAERK
jgi:hypothetical protein